jgi:hypothetical protein
LGTLGITDLGSTWFDSAGRRWSSPWFWVAVIGVAAALFILGRATQAEAAGVRAGAKPTASQIGHPLGPGTGRPPMTKPNEAPPAAKRPAPPVESTPSQLPKLAPPPPKARPGSASVPPARPATATPGGTASAPPPAPIPWLPGCAASRRRCQPTVGARLGRPPPSATRGSRPPVSELTQPQNSARWSVAATPRSAGWPFPWEPAPPKPRRSPAKGRHRAIHRRLALRGGRALCSMATA